MNKITDTESKVCYGFKNGTNAGNDYLYASNGKLTKDLNKSITHIAYNHLNLPKQISINRQSIDYVYNAAGTKLRKTAAGITTDYIDGYQYENGKLQFFPHAEGYVTVENGQYEYVYDYTDHLGNIRLSYTDANGNGTINQTEIIEENNYYPFGLKHSELTATQIGVENKYTFQGQELQDDFDLGWYDYGARMYDADLGRWFVMDPMAEKYQSFSPFNYTLNNPIIFIDPDREKVRFAKGVSKQFKKDFATAVQYLNKHGAAGMLSTLEKSEETYYVKEGENKSAFSSKTKTITWDPDMGGLTTEDKFISPTTILNHEIDHALQFDQNPEQYKKDSYTEDKDYGDKEEKRVITGSEQETAKKLGEIKEGEITRKDHEGFPYQTKGPTTTEHKLEVIIEPTEKKEEEIIIKPIEKKEKEKY